MCVRVCIQDTYAKVRNASCMGRGKRGREREGKKEIERKNKAAFIRGPISNSAYSERDLYTRVVYLSCSLLCSDDFQVFALFFFFLSH